MTDFGCIIISHQRADYLADKGTYGLLKKSGYTGEIVVVVDDLDPELEKYRAKFKNLYVFSKEDSMKSGTYDMMDNFTRMACACHARNEAYNVAVKYGYKHYAVLDDDVIGLYYRSGKEGKLGAKKIADLDRLFGMLVDWMDSTGAYGIGFSSSGWLIGGLGDRRFKLGIKRMIANCYICSTERRVVFNGSVNEDMVADFEYGPRGRLLFSPVIVTNVTEQTQSVKGGMTEVYKDEGTYTKAFYPLMVAPSGVKVCVMGVHNYRIHHRTDGNALFPKILNERWRKTNDSE